MKVLFLLPVSPMTEWKVKTVVPGTPFSSVGSGASHVPRLCSGPGFDSWPESLCCVSLPLSLPLFPVISSADLSIRPKALKKKNKAVVALEIPPSLFFNIMQHSGRHVIQPENPNVCDFSSTSLLLEKNQTKKLFSCQWNRENPFDGLLVSRKLLWEDVVTLTCINSCPIMWENTVIVAALSSTRDCVQHYEKSSYHFLCTC